MVRGMQKHGYSVKMGIELAILPWVPATRNDHLPTTERATGFFNFMDIAAS